MLISFMTNGSLEPSACRRRDLTFSNPLSLFRKASMANESSKLFLFSGMVFSPLLEKGLGQGGAALKHAASCLNGIMRDRLNGNLSLIHQGDQHLPPRLEPDLFADLSRSEERRVGKECR